MRNDMVWTADGHLVLGAGGPEKVKRGYLSPSSASAINQCPARHAADRMLPRTEEPFSDAELGTSAHSILEALFDLPGPERTRRAARSLLSALLFAETVKHPELADVRTKHRWLNAVWIRTRGIWGIENPVSTVVRRNEWRIGENGKEDELEPGEERTGIVVLNGVPFFGYIDRTEYRSTAPGAEVSVGDYKTGKASAFNPRWTDSHGDQLRLYAAAIEVLDGKRPAHAKVLYTRYGKQRFVSLTDKEMASTLERFADAWRKLHQYADANEFPAQASGLCPWCPLVAGCPTAKKAGKATDAAKDGTVIKLSVRPRTMRPSLAPKTPGGAPPMIDAPERPAPAGTPPTAPPAPFAADRADDFDDTRPAGSGARHRPPTSGGYTIDEPLGGEPMLQEDKPWEATVGGQLNPNSYSATAVFGTVAMATRALHDAGQKINGANVSALAQTFMHIVESVQIQFTGSSSPQQGMNVRLRGMLHTTIETLPIPFGGSNADWEAWVTAATKRVTAMSNIAVALFDDGTIDQPWTALAFDSDADADAFTEDRSDDHAEPQAA
jgi:putative RecB family exonuclease